jgi:hypothetical protein
MDKVTSIESQGKSRRRRSSRPTTKAVATRPSDEHWKMAKEAYRLKVSGRTFSEIAEILDLPDKAEAHRLLVERFAYDAASLTSQERKDILGMELLRLDALQVAVWDSAMMGDPKSVDSALKIIQTRARITGIEQVDPVVNKNLVLVMGEREQDYIDQLKAVDGSTGPG